MGAIMKVNYSDHVVTVALYHYSFEWAESPLHIRFGSAD